MKMKKVTLFTRGGKTFACGMKIEDIPRLRKHLDDPQRKYELFNLANYIRKEDRTNAEFNMRPMHVEGMIVEDINAVAATKQKILVPQIQQRPQTIKLKGP